MDSIRKFVNSEPCVQNREDAGRVNERLDCLLSATG